MGYETGRSIMPPLLKTTSSPAPQVQCRQPAHEPGQRDAEL